MSLHSRLILAIALLTAGLSYAPARSDAAVAAPVVVQAAPTGLPPGRTRVLVSFDPGLTAPGRNARATFAGGRVTGEVPELGWTIVEPLPGRSAGAVLLEIAAGGSARRVELDAPAWPAVAPGDPMYPQLWGLSNTGQTGGLAGADIRAEEAWETTTGAHDVIVAVVDQGVQIDHPDLADNIWSNPGEVPGNGIDDDGNGYIDDVHGWDFVNDDATVFDPADGDAHGTHVAGTIGAVGDNGLGVAGVNWQVSIMPLKFLGPSGGTISDAARAIVYAVDHGATVINHSWTSPTSSAMFDDAIAYAAHAEVINVAAAGNNGRDLGSYSAYPGGLEATNVITVAATDDEDKLAGFSNFSDTIVDLAAPGVGIVSTVPDATYGSMNGTSMATPHVSGAIALLAAAYPGESGTRLRERIDACARPVPALADKVVTGGVLDLAKAIDEYTGLPLRGRFAIDDDAAYTTAREVSLDSAVDDATEMRFDLGAGFDGWRPYAPQAAGLLSGADGVRTVRAEYRDARGDVLTLTDTILLDTTPPTPPETLAASGIGAGWVEIEWSASAAGDVAAYELWRSPLPDGQPVRVKTVTAAQNRRVRDSGLTDGVAYRYRVRAIDSHGLTGADSAGLLLTPGVDAARVAGRNRYTTALAASRTAFSSADTVVLATGEEFADALGAASLAGAHEAPILLTPPDRLPPGLLDELRRLGARGVVIVGGTRAVSPAVERELAAAGYPVSARLAGSDRYETAVLIAEETLRVRDDSPAPTTAFVVRGDAFPDALAVAPVAYAARIPILLVGPDGVPGSLADAAGGFGLTRMVAVGGESAVPDRVVSEFGVGYKRWAGADRYETAAVVAARAVASGYAGYRAVGVATGAGFPDALGGGAAIGARGGVLLLTVPNALAPSTAVILRGQASVIESLWLFGGEAALSSAVSGEALGLVGR